MAPSLYELFANADARCSESPARSEVKSKRRISEAVLQRRVPAKSGEEFGGESLQGRSDAPKGFGLRWPRCHDKFVPSCARCRWQKLGARWQSLYGTFSQKQGTCARQITWLTEAPCRTSRKWGIGCAVCAELQWRLMSSTEQAPRQARTWSTKWARHEICGVSQMQASAILQHSRTAVHKIALMAHLRPERPVSEWISVHTATEATDRELLQGAVPQVRNWLLAWRCLQNPCSWSAASAIQATSLFATSGRGASRKALRSMTTIMAEVVREQKRMHLKQAESVSISVDDRGEFRLVRYRCSFKPGTCDGTGWHRESEAMRSATGDYAREGVLALLRKHDNSSGMSLVDVDEDYSYEMKESIVRAVRRLFTPLHGVCDETEVQRFMCKVNTYVADGASSAQKAGAVMQAQGGGFPFLYLVLRDAAHQLRISTMGPLKYHTDFEAFWNRIFDERHALAPDLQNSSVWKEFLELAQNTFWKNEAGWEWACQFH